MSDLIENLKKLRTSIFICVEEQAAKEISLMVGGAIKEIQTLTQQLEEANQKYGLLKIHCEHETRLKESCEKALSDRDAQLEEVRLERDELKRVVSIHRKSTDKIARAFSEQTNKGE